MPIARRELPALRGLDAAVLRREGVTGLRIDPSIAEPAVAMPAEPIVAMPVGPIVAMPVEPVVALPAEPIVALPVGPFVVGGRPVDIVARHRFPLGGILGPWVIPGLMSVSRTTLTVPVSPVAPIVAETLLESPDPSDGKRFYLPRFTEAFHDVDGIRTERVTVRPSESGWTFALDFQSEPRAGGTDPLPVTVEALLRYEKPTTPGIVEERSLALQASGPGAWSASLGLATLTERDELIHALTRESFRCRLVMRCAFQAATPAEIAEGTGEQLYRAATQLVDVIFARDPFLFDPDTNPNLLRGITGVGDTVQAVTLRPLEWEGRVHHYYQDGARPYLFRYLPDAFKVTRRSAAPHSPSLAVRVDPGDGTPEAMRASLEYVASPVVDADRLVDASARLARHLPSTLPQGITGPVFEPLVVDDVARLKLVISLPRAGAGGSSRQERPGVVTSLTSPFADEITDLTQEGLQQIYDALFGSSAVLFTGEVQVGLEDKKFAATVPFVARLTDLYGPIFDVVETPHADGSVELALRNATESPVVLRSIPARLVAGDRDVAARVEGLSVAGEPAAFPVALAADQVLSCRVTDAAGPPAPPLRRGDSGPGVTALQTALVAAGQAVAVDGDFGPITEEAVRAVQTAHGLPADGVVDMATRVALGLAEAPAEQGGPADAVFNLDDVEVTPDSTAVWDAMREGSVPVTSTWPVDVRALPVMFRPPAEGAAGTAVVAVAIHFKNGPSVLLSPENLRETVEVPVSLLVLPQEWVGEYRYTQETIREDGSRTTEQKSDTKRLLIPVVGP
jgi:hypothetical protein